MLANNKNTKDLIDVLCEADTKIAEAVQRFCAGMSCNECVLKNTCSPTSEICATLDKLRDLKFCEHCGASIK